MLRCREIDSPLFRCSGTEVGHYVSVALIRSLQKGKSRRRFLVALKNAFAMAAGTGGNGVPVRIAKAWGVRCSASATRNTWRRAATGATPSRRTWFCRSRKGGSAVPYHLEDPAVRREFEATLARSGIASRMKPEFYLRPAAAGEEVPKPSEVRGS